MRRRASARDPLLPLASPVRSCASRPGIYTAALAGTTSRSCPELDYPRRIGIPRTTGVLLLGGASSRFGRPKALAEFRGERLVDRAWRVLGEAFDVRLAVGKRHEAPEVPFSVLDDGFAERAPIAGVLAGLRASTTVVTVFLPVDCPLVTAELLRALATAHAVPQTGPLPGAYDPSHLPELERRVAAGTYSLRGVNSRVLDIDPRLVADADTPEELERLR